MTKPAPWPSVRLGDIVEVRTGLPTSSRPADKGVSIPVINLRDIIASDVLSDSTALERIQFDKPRRADMYAVLPGDVLLSSRGAALRTALVGQGLAEPTIASSNLLVLRPSDRVLPTVLLAWLRSVEVQRALLSRSRSSSLSVALKRDDIADLEFPVPPLEVQRQIAAVVGATQRTYDSMVEVAEKRRQLGVAVVEQLFTGVVTPQE